MSEGNLELATGKLIEPEASLLRYAEKLTLEPANMTALDTQTLRDQGWTEAQIAEAIYVIALFAFFNRVADAFGIA